jgi:hypothetical protein
MGQVARRLLVYYTVMVSSRGSKQSGERAVLDKRQGLAGDSTEN